MPKPKAAATRKKPGPKPGRRPKKPERKPRKAIRKRRKPGPKPGSRRRRMGTTAAVRTRTRRAGRRPGRKPSGGAKKPFSIVLDARELKALKEIAKKKNSSVAGLIRGAMNAVVFQANPQLARSALEKDVDDFLDGIKGKLPMSARFDGRKKGLKKNLVDGIISHMETG